LSTICTDFALRYDIHELFIALIAL
jgi:hypothetical protein